MKELTARSKVTGKRQITIPLELYNLLNIKVGDQVVFKQQGDVIVFEKDTEMVECFACRGEKAIGNSECFICYGQGKLEQNVASDFTKVMGNIMMKGLKYKIGMSYKSQEMKNGQVCVKDYPIYELQNRGNYPQDEILRIQDEIQKKIIEHFAPRVKGDNTLFAYPPDDVLVEILDTLVTDEAKSEVKRWFRYERTILNDFL